MLAVRSLAVALALAAVVACDVAEPSAKVQTYRVEGRVEQVMPEQGQVVIDHEDIPGLMPGMTMNFDVPNAAVLGRMRPGQRVAFDLELRDRSFRLVDVLVLEDAGSAGMSGSFVGGTTRDEIAPAFTLVDQDGETRALTDFAGRFVLLDFVYTHCPGPCPILTGQHVVLQERLPPALAERVQFVSISLDPERDTPEAMKAYGEARGVDFANWSFLTGDRDTLEKVWRDYGVGTGVQADGEIEHLVITVVVDGEGRIAKRYLGLEHSVDAVQADLERAIAAG